MEQPATEQAEHITVTEDGPYRVECEVEVVNADGHVVSTEGKVFLCRCGGSQNKPFCDGTHAKNDFSGREVADRGPIEQRRDAYVGNGITIYDDRSVCAHAGECTDHLPSVWKLKTEPWIDPKGASAEPIGPLSRARGNPGDVLGRGGLRATQPPDALPLRRVEKQAVLRRNALARRFQGPRLTSRGRQPTRALISGAAEA